MNHPKRVWLAVLVLVVGLFYAIRPLPGVENRGIFRTTPEERRVALVIGNGSYTGESLGKLKNPGNDADDIGKALKKFGFNVNIYKNLSKLEMENAIAEFGRQANHAEAAFFFFAGHGLQIKGRNYLMPIDANANSEALAAHSGINLNLVLEEMDNARSATNIVMLDACRDNKFSGRFRGGQLRGLAAPSSVPKGTVIAYATDPGNVALDGDGRNGLFTSGLLTGFQSKDLSLAGVLLSASIYVEEKSNGNQTPYVNGPETVKSKFKFSGNEGEDEDEALPPPDLEFVKIPKGCFQMGMSKEEQKKMKSHEKYDDFFKNAEDRHEVCVDAFELGIRVYRGGSWYNSPAYVRSADRGSNDPGGRGSYLGFRLARTVP